MTRRGPPARRLRELRRHLSPAAAAETETEAAPPRLLTSQQVKDYIVNGFVVLTVDELPAAGFNAAFYAEARRWPPRRTTCCGAS